MKLNKGNISIVILLFLTVFSFQITNTAFAEEWSDIYQQIKSNYNDYNKEINDMKIIQQGTMNIGSEKMDAEMEISRKGDKYRIESKMSLGQDSQAGMPGLESTIIYDGKDAWIISPFTGKSKIPSEEGSKNLPGNDWFDFIPKDADYKGIEDVNGRSCYHIEVDGADKMPYKNMWIDNKTYVLVKAEGTAPGGEKLIWVFSDFNKIMKNWEIPYKTETFVNGNTLSTLTITSLDVNKGLSDDLFDASLEKGEDFDFQKLMQSMMQEENQKEQKQQ